MSAKKKAPAQPRDTWHEPTPADMLRYDISHELYLFKDARETKSFGVRSLAALAAQLLPTIATPQTWANMSPDERMQFFGLSDVLQETGDYPAPEHPHGFVELAREAVNRASLLLWAAEKKLNIWGMAHETVLPRTNFEDVISALRSRTKPQPRRSKERHDFDGRVIVPLILFFDGRESISEAEFLEIAFRNLGHSKEVEIALWRDYIGVRKPTFDVETTLNELFDFRTWLPQNYERVTKARQRKKKHVAATKGGDAATAAKDAHDGYQSFSADDDAKIHAAAKKAKQKSPAATLRRKSRKIT